jgi:hypothetical protein
MRAADAKMEKRRATAESRGVEFRGLTEHEVLFAAL